MIHGLMIGRRARFLLLIAVAVLHLTRILLSSPRSTFRLFPLSERRLSPCRNALGKNRSKPMPWWGRAEAEKCADDTGKLEGMPGQASVAIASLGKGGVR
jgi:hypothetical protein